ncbi:MAG: biotin--[acetyl-CoA-carboxylase] ligase [Elainellaceae cyanobacterium]
MNPHFLDPIAIQTALAARHSSQNSTFLESNEEKNEEQNESLPPWNLRIYNRLASTTLTLWDSIQRGAPSHTVVIAQEQTQGRGQRGREWVSAPGGLYLSTAIRPDVPIQQPQQHLTLATAWGIATQFRALGIRVGLKWPNDLVVNGRKLGGILIETRSRGDRLLWVCIGVGINWSNPVPPTGINVHELLRQEFNPSAINDLAALILRGITLGLDRCQPDEAMAIARDYENLLVNRGQHVSWTSAEGECYEGVVVGVNVAGELRVQGRHSRPTVKLSEPSRGVLSHASIDSTSISSEFISSGSSGFSDSSEDPLTEFTFAPGSLRLGYGRL